MRYPVEEAVHPTEDKVIYLAVMGASAEHLGAEHRHERKGADGGHDHDDADYPAQLAEEHSGHTLNHRQRQEHTKHGEG